MVDTESRQRVELIITAVDAGFERVPATTKVGHAALFEVRQATQDYLREVDWDATGLLPSLMYTRRGEPVMMQPNQSVNLLTVAAFDDAEALIRASLDSAVGVALPLGAPSRSLILKNSKRSLLTVAQLDIDDRDELFMLLADPNGNMASTAFGGSVAGSLIELSPDEYDRWRFGWKAPVQQWIGERITAADPDETGCPAARMAVSDRSQTVLHYFWDRMVDRACPEPKKPTT